MKIDKRKKFICVLDTETAPLDRNARVSGTNGLVYDLGYQIVDKKGNVYVSRSFVIEEIFKGESDRMQSAYYAWKIPMYLEAIENHEMQVVSIWEARRQLREDMEMYHCTTICAHNAIFDYQALRTTIKYLTHGEIHSFYPYEVELWDSLKMARSTICQNKTYKYYVGDTKRKSAKAEDLFKYISCNDDFVESHTGLKDVEIETQIMVKCLASHKKMTKRLFSE